MIEVPSTWGAVKEGTTLLSPKGAPLVVVRVAKDRRGRTWFQCHDHNKRKIRIAPKPSDLEVTLLECTPEEAEGYAKLGLGAERILDFERENRMAERAKQWILPPFPTKGRRALDQARDHLSWYHGTYSADAESGGFKTLKQMIRAHEEMHEQVFMDLPHTHKGE